MNYKSRLKLARMKKWVFDEGENAPMDPLMEELEELNKDIWDEDLRKDEE